MAIGVTGNFPSEFDSTTQAALNTCAAAGVQDADIMASQEFLCDIAKAIGEYRPQYMPEHQKWIEAMDCAFIGILMHRHVPFVSENGVLVFNPHGPSGWMKTLHMITHVCTCIENVPKEVVESVGEEGLNLGISILRPVDPDDQENPDRLLYEQFAAYSIIGMLTHRLLPTSTENPMRGLNDGHE